MIDMTGIALRIWLPTLGSREALCDEENKVGVCAARCHNDLRSYPPTDAPYCSLDPSQVANLAIDCLEASSSCY